MWLGRGFRGFGVGRGQFSTFGTVLMEEGGRGRGGGRSKKPKFIVKPDMIKMTEDILNITAHQNRRKQPPKFNPAEGKMKGICVGKRKNAFSLHTGSPFLRGPSHTFGTLPHKTHQEQPDKKKETKRRRDASSPVFFFFGGENVADVFTSPKKKNGQCYIVLVPALFLTLVRLTFFVWGSPPTPCPHFCQRRPPSD